MLLYHVLIIAYLFTLLLYNIEHIRKARIIDQTFSFIGLSLKRLKYEIKHDNFGHIY